MSSAWIKQSVGVGNVYYSQSVDICKSAVTVFLNLKVQKR